MTPHPSTPATPSPQGTATAAGAGLEHYIGVFRVGDTRMFMVMLIILPVHFFSHWRETGITEQAKGLKG